jgi:acetyl-CoA synthetase
VKAFVVLGQGARTVERDVGGDQDVRAGHLSAFVYPREIESVDDLPKTLTGEIRRIEVRDAEREKKRALASG